MKTQNGSATQKTYEIATRTSSEIPVQAGALQSAIFNSANFSSIATDAKGVIQIFNVGAERMLGYTAAEVMNKITPADISDPQEVIARAEALTIELETPILPGFEALVFKASRGIEDIYELTYIRKDGSRFPAVVSVTALRDDENTIIGYLLIGTDNTARKQAEEALHKAGALQSAIFNSANFSSIATDAKGVIQIFNVGAERMLGYTAVEVMNKITPADISDPQEVIARAEALTIELETPILPGFEALVFKASRGIEDIYELTYIRKDGSRFPAVVSVTALRDDENTIIGYLLIGTDNTARKQAEESLRKAGALQSAIFNSANFSSIATDAKGVIQIFNVGAERMLGYTAVEVMDKITPADISDPQEVIARAESLTIELETPITPGFEALVFKASRGIEDIYELTYIRKDGSRFPAVVSVTALRDDENTIIGYLLIGTDNTARKQIEEEQKQLSQRLRDHQFYTRSLFESNIDAIMTTDPSGIITDVNKQMEVLTDCTRDELIGAPFKNYFTDPGRAETTIKKVLSEKKVTNYELTARARDGKETVVSFNATTFYDRDRKLQGVFAAARDVTERKRLDQVLYEKNVELESARIVRRQKALALDERNKELSCLYSIITFCNMPGIPLDELLMKSVMRIPPASHFPGITEASIEMNGISFQTASFRETPWMLASDITVQGTKIGQLKLCYLEERQASDEGPFQIHERHLLNAIAEKLSLAIERKQAETELQESNDRFNQLAAQRGTIVWEVDAQGLYTYISHVSEAVLGYRSDEIVGCMHFYDLHPEPGREAFKKAALAVFKRKETFNDLENCIQKKDGGLAWVTTYGSPILNSDGVLMGYRGSDTDITEKKSTIEQLIHSQKMESIGQLAGGLAHDLNNILSVVSGYTTLAQLGMDKNEKVFTYLNEITRASSRAASLTHSLLAYSRKQEMNQRNQNLNLVVETVGSFISRIIHDNITFTLSLQDDPLGVYVDTVQIEQVLLNLATNARDAMPEGGVFSIATATNCIDDQFIAIHGYGTLGRYAVITVTDSGHGMDEQTRIKVFDPFFTTKEAGKGTGLGLAMTMGIIKQHGGFIDLQSEPGKGSVFQLFLPLVDSGESAAETTEQSLQMENVSGTILVAEDDADTCSAMEELLTRVGYTVITAVDGQDAVEKYTARKDEIDLVIFDVVMPRKGGKAASDEMRAMSENVKFIFVSGYSSDVREREGGLGADVEIIVKPILPYELIKSIKALMPTVSERSP